MSKKLNNDSGYDTDKYVSGKEQEEFHLEEIVCSAEFSCIETENPEEE